MVKISTPLSISILHLFSQVSYLLAKCCPGDLTCSGCWMCEGCELRTCVDTWTAQSKECMKKDDVHELLECSCKAYGKLAECWSQGVCCTEYAPSLAGATNICNYRTWPKDWVTKEMVEEVVREADQVRNTIWHNDSGYNIPKLSVHVQPHDSSSSDSSQSSSYSSYSPSYQKSSYSSRRTHTEDHTYAVQANSDIKLGNKLNLEAPKLQSESHQEKPKPKPPQQHYEPKSKPQVHHQSAPESKPHSNPSHDDASKKKAGFLDSSKKIHHQAKCSVQQHKCQKTIASQYRQARHSQSHSHHKNKLIKRDETLFKNPPKSYSGIDNVQLWKRTNSYDSESGHRKCGISFQGIAYPHEIPESVKHIFSS